jgi:hypothetical protein
MMVDQIDLLDTLDLVIHGKQEVQEPNNFKRFVEAILAQGNPCVSVERLVSSQSALKGL